MEKLVTPIRHVVQDIFSRKYIRTHAFSSVPHVCVYISLSIDFDDPYLVVLGDGFTGAFAEEELHSVPHSKTCFRNYSFPHP